MKMISKIREPKSQKEIDRNLMTLGWMIILPSLGLLFGPNTALLFLLLIGGFSRLLVVAIRLPKAERGFFRYLISGFMILVGLVIQVEIRTEFRLDLSILFLVYFWGSIAYADTRFLRYNRAQQAEAPQLDPAASRKFFSDS